MSESSSSEHEAWQEHVKKLKQKVSEGKINPYEDPETQEQINQANASQLNQTEEEYNPTIPLPRSLDQDPDSPAQHLPRKPFGKPINQPVVSQSTLDGGVEKVVLSREGNSRVLKSAQPYERGRLGINTPKDNQEANQQRQQIRKDMRKRGQDV